MSLRLYNTLTRTKEEFRPLDPENVRMYVCGPTVYDFAHIGNARPAIVFDVLFRLLRHLYGPEHVTYVRNITDVDDKINARALRDFPDLPLNEAIRKVTETTANQYFADVKALGCLEPTMQPRATENIAQMVAMIGELIKRGHAYVSEGEVLFSVPSMPEYGALSQRNLEDQQAGARIAVEAHKKNPADFVLWKLSSAEEPGWDSPWGRGRPGWHIECSAMSNRYLWDEAKGKLTPEGLAHPHEFDIHGGGLDLIFPHHENEIAQSRCAHGTDVMAKVWMHNGFLQVEGRKMSKSLGNFVTINELLAQGWPGEVLKFNMLRTHYRQPIDWTNSGLHESADMLYELFDAAGEAIFDTRIKKPHPEIVKILSDDLNTPDAIRFLYFLRTSPLNSEHTQKQLLGSLRFLGLSRTANDNRSIEEASSALWRRLQTGDNIDAAFMKIREAYGLSSVRDSQELANRLWKKLSRLESAQREIDRLASIHSGGIRNLYQQSRRLRNDLVHQVASLTELSASSLNEESISNLIAARLEARKAKNWAESDRIRDELAAMGIAIKDNKDGTTSWEVKR